ncbi:hypothetical protein J6590_090231 [Homalodisca vitripennis]|nr:hypothetical protein J6590_090231 [Homalodisca vitripennis]
MTLTLRFGPSGRQEQQVSCWNLAGKSLIVIQCCTEGYDRGKRNRSKSRVDVSGDSRERSPSGASVSATSSAQKRSKPFLCLGRRLKSGNPLLSVSRVESIQKNWNSFLENTEIVLLNSRRFDTVVQVRLDQEIIETMSALMYLGVMLDTNLTVWDHIFVVPNKAEFLPFFEWKRVYEGSSVFTEAREHTMRNYGCQSVEKVERPD